MGNEPQKICFVISPIDEEGTEVRKRSDQVLKHVITPAVEGHGFKALRADHISEPGIITTQVVQHVIDDPLVVADLTDSNPNVFYELALRHVARKPLVQLIRKGDRIPFDVGWMRTIQVDLTDPDSLIVAREDLIRQVEAVLRSGWEMETPITRALELKKLDESSDPQKRLLGEILSAISGLQSMIADVKQQLPPAIRGVRAIRPATFERGIDISKADPAITQATTPGQDSESSSGGPSP